MAGDEKASKSTGVGTAAGWIALVALGLWATSGAVWLIGSKVVPEPERIITVNGERVTEEEYAEIRSDQLKALGKDVVASAGRSAWDGVRALFGGSDDEPEAPAAEEDASLAIEIRHPDRSTTVLAGWMFRVGAVLCVGGIGTALAARIMGDRRHRVYFAFWPFWLVVAIAESCSA